MRPMCMTVDREESVSESEDESLDESSDSDCSEEQIEVVEPSRVGGLDRVDEYLVEGIGSLGFRAPCD